MRRQPVLLARADVLLTPPTNASETREGAPAGGFLHEMIYETQRKDLLDYAKALRQVYVECLAFRAL